MPPLGRPTERVEVTSLQIEEEAEDVEDVFFEEDVIFEDLMFQPDEKEEEEKEEEEEEEEHPSEFSIRILSTSNCTLFN